MHGNYDCLISDPNHPKTGSPRAPHSPVVVSKRASYEQKPPTAEKRSPFFTPSFIVGEFYYTLVTYYDFYYATATHDHHQPVKVERACLLCEYECDKKPSLCQQWTEISVISSYNFFPFPHRVVVSLFIFLSFLWSGSLYLWRTLREIFPTWEKKAFFMHLTKTPTWSEVGGCQWWSSRKKDERSIRILCIRGVFIVHLWRYGGVCVYIYVQQK